MKSNNFARSLFIYHEKPLGEEHLCVLKKGHPEDYLANISRLKIQDRDQSLIGRGALRLLLALLSGSSPEDISIIQEAGQKPRCPSLPCLDFNLSHCSGAVTAVVSNNRVGIDVEKIGIFEEELIPLVLNRTEREWFMRVKESELSEVFYRLWTYKEAYLKFLGTGFSKDPTEVILDENFRLKNDPSVIFSHYRFDKNLLLTICSKEYIGRPEITTTSKITRLLNRYINYDVKSNLSLQNSMRDEI